MVGLRGEAEGPAVDLRPGGCCGRRPRCDPIPPSPASCAAAVPSHVAAFAVDFGTLFHCRRRRDRVACWKSLSQRFVITCWLRRLLRSAARVISPPDGRSRWSSWPGRAGGGLVRGRFVVRARRAVRSGGRELLHVPGGRDARSRESPGGWAVMRRHVSAWQYVACRGGVFEGRRGSSRCLRGDGMHGTLSCFLHR